jgi:hypothetical protein
VRFPQPGNKARKQKARVRYLRSLRWSHYRISQALGISLSESRRLADSRAEALHEQWQQPQ